MSKDYAGVFIAPICPMKLDQSIDESGLHQYLRWLLNRAEISGLVDNVNAGEGPYLDNNERIEVISIANKCRNTNQKLVAGICGNSTKEMLLQANTAEEAGADAVIVIPMRDWQNSRGPGHAEMLFKRLAENTSLPLIVFQSVSAHFDTETLLRILELPQVTAVKQAVTDIALYQEQYSAIRSQRPDVSILSAYDAALLPTFAIGADGVLLGIAGLLPDLVVELYNAARNDQYDKARQLSLKLEPMSHYLYALPPRSLRHIRTKAALKIMGIINSDMVREPLLPLDGIEKNKLNNAMLKAGLLSN